MCCWVRLGVSAVSTGDTTAGETRFAGVTRPGSPSGIGGRLVAKALPEGRRFAVVVAGVVGGVGTVSIGR